MIFKRRVISTCLTGLLTVVFLIIFLSACSGNDNEAGGIDYSPSEDGDIKVSTSEEQGIDRALIDRLYKKAEGVETIESLLVIKNGYIIAEKYYGEGGLIGKEESSR